MKPETNDKIPSGSACETKNEQGYIILICPCHGDTMYCQVFNSDLDYDDFADSLRCAECLAAYPNGGHIVPDT